MMRGDSKRVETLRAIYDTVGASTFRASDVPVNSHLLQGMHLDGMLDKVAKIHIESHTAIVWRISRDALCTLRGEKIDRTQSRRRMHYGKKINE